LSHVTDVIGGNFSEVEIEAEKSLLGSRPGFLELPYYFCFVRNSTYTVISF